MARATSSTVAILYRGMFEAALFVKSLYSYSDIPVYLYIFDSIVAGETAFIRIPIGASSSAEHLVSISKPALVMQ